MNQNTENSSDFSSSNIKIFLYSLILLTLGSVRQGFPQFKKVTFSTLDELTIKVFSSRYGPMENNNFFRAAADRGRKSWAFPAVRSHMSKAKNSSCKRKN
jgi:hypothetical protein